MNRTARLFAVLLGFAATHVFAQYEDLSNLPGSKASEKVAPVCALQGIQVMKKEGLKGAKEVSIAFRFASKPSVFFNYYDAQKKAVVFDFYDAHLGKLAVSSVQESPITRSTVDSVQIDLNKDAKGIEPDIRDVVRISLYTPYDLEYDAQGHGATTTMNFKWSPAKEAEIKKKKNALYWQLPLAVGVAGGLGFGAYEFLKKAPEEPVPNPLGATPGVHPPSQ